MELICIKAAAKLLGIARSTFYDLAREAGWAKYRIGSSPRYDRDELVAWIKSKRER
jgi:excisionase family DNA binding protein